MSEEKKIQPFTAADIERYHKGLLTPAERNAMEKAALDDPFLADALEGYAVEGVNVTADIRELKARLQKRTEEKKLIPISSTNKGFYYFRAAAAIILLAGAGWLVYQYSFSKKPAEIAQLKTQNKSTDSNNTALPPVTSAPVANGLFTDSTPNKKETTTTRVITQSGKGAAGKKEVKAKAPTVNRNDITSGLIKDEKKNDGPGEVIVKANADEKIRSQDSLARSLSGRVAGIAVRTEQKPVDDKNAAAEKDVVVAKGIVARGKEANPAPRELTYQTNQPSNEFRGTVRSNTNEPVPFANVNNISNKTSTYTDANGNFQLRSNDSVIKVEVASVGYEKNNALLKNNISNDVVLNPSRNQLSEVVVTAYKKDEDEEQNDIKYDSEPADGWDKYNLYLQNNTRVPPSFKSGAAGFVELSFDVNRKGRPVNIKVEASLSKDCDHEAKRLVKEGPNWKKGSGKVKIYFR